MTSHTETRTTTRTQWLQFARHFVEMTVAMFAGMFALAPLWSLAWPGYDDNTTVNAMVMATNMTIGMVAVMLWRRHSTRAIVEMSAAMYVPFLLLLVPYWFGAVSEHAVMMAGHTLMFPAMLLAMWLRRHEYLGHHHAH